MEHIFMNRELSWLDFDKRVLELGDDKNVPLAERLKFISIWGSNLDEFFMVRVGSLYERALLTSQAGKSVVQLNTEPGTPEPQTKMTPQEQINAILPKVELLQKSCDEYFATVVNAFDEMGYSKVDFSNLSKEQERFWKKYFQNELYPVLSPQIVDNRHPFPFLRNKEIYLAVLLKSKRAEGQRLGIIPISSQTERVIFVKTEYGFVYALVEEMIEHYASCIFGKDKIQSKCLFRVTRNADLTVKEGMMDYDIDYRSVMSDLLKKRRKLAAVRLQFMPTAPEEIASLLCEKLLLPKEHCFVQNSPLDLGFLFKIAAKIESTGRQELFYPTAKPMQAPAEYDLDAVVAKRDVLLSYPYQSIRPFITMLQKAAKDPSVVSIKMTLYRMAHESQIVQALMDAAENGKEVLALVELRARFDEQNNIDWSKQLESAGCTVIYGHEEYKVHSKLTLITRRKNGMYSYVTQIGTGNYNEKTSELYTDFSYITSKQEIGEEASAVFQKISVHKLTETCQTMLVAPLCFKSVLLDEMERLIEAAAAGRDVSMVIKNNSVNDKDIMQKMCEASCAGVQVDMIVRGICCVRAGVPAKSENVRVRSLVGRYLEHARIYSFTDAGETRVYIASGDFLTRNTECRVEVGVRVTDAHLMKKLQTFIDLQLADNTNACEMQPDGSYIKVLPASGEARVDSQMGMYDLLREDWENDLALSVTKKERAQKPIVRKTVPVSQTLPDKDGMTFWEKLKFLFGK
ncbi:MAG: polyphosphate kinase 1 [Faecalibacterium sp.]